MAFVAPLTCIHNGVHGTTIATTTIPRRSVTHAVSSSSSSLFAAHRLSRRSCFGRRIAGTGNGVGGQRLTVRSDATPPPPSSSNLSDDDKLMLDLQDEGTPRQVIAMSRVVSIGGLRAVGLLRDSGALKSAKLKTRIAALDALGKLRQPSEITFLVSVLQTDRDHSVRAAAAGGLSYLAEKNAAAALRSAAIQDDHFIVRYSAIVALGEIADLASAPLLLPLVQNPNSPPLEVAAAIDALGTILDSNHTTQTYVDAVTQHATHADDLIRAAVARTLVAWKSVPGVADTLSDMIDFEVERKGSFVLALLQKLLEEDRELN